MVMKRPNFFIVGAPKCGTTSMTEYLKQHPDIFMPELKEPHYFCIDIASRRITRTEEHYLKLFAEARDERRLGEASVWYLFSQQAASEIYKFNPLSRIIIMLRSPVDMMYSLHSQFIFSGNENIPDFEQALEAEEDRRNGRRIPQLAHSPESLLYTEVAKYSEQVKRYFEVFDREQVHIIIFDDLINDTAGIYKATLKFLDVNPGFQPPSYDIFNPHRVVRSKLLLTLKQVIRIIGRGVYKPLFPNSEGLGIVSNLVRLNTRYGQRPPMDINLRKRLQKMFVPEVYRLSDLLGCDLTAWLNDS
jgi:hypothetical protein